ncbi:hypothetical protein HMPREF3156_00642 [Neisseria sp. HMSC06F02]|nr:hypothetical protein HMPREF3156_00642 [Neisseria sp. HMSC06F02]
MSEAAVFVKICRPNIIFQTTFCLFNTWVFNTVTDRRYSRAGGNPGLSSWKPIG